MPSHLSAGLLVALTALSLTAAASTAKPRVTTQMFDDRYCEILAVTGAVPNLVADVWNTYGLNTCPPALWQSLDAAALSSELGALTVRLNGPRFWLIDSASIHLAPGTGRVRSFGGLRMRKIAQVQVPMTNGVPGLAPYTATTVLRRTTFTWTRRQRIHELVAPDGSVYVMQAYAQIVDPTLTVDALPGLGARLQLPAGWSYRTRRLRKPLVLTTTGEATVVQDELMNTYQLS